MEMVRWLTRDWGAVIPPNSVVTSADAATTSFVVRVCHVCRVCRVCRSCDRSHNTKLMRVPHLALRHVLFYAPARARVRARRARARLRILPQPPGPYAPSPNIVIIIIIILNQNTRGAGGDAACIPRVVPCLQEDDLQLRAIGELYDLVRTDKAHVEDALSMGLPITILPLLLSEKFVSAPRRRRAHFFLVVSATDRQGLTPCSHTAHTAHTSRTAHYTHNTHTTHTVRHCSKRACD